MNVLRIEYAIDYARKSSDICASEGIRGFGNGFEMLAETIEEMHLAQADLLSALSMIFKHYGTQESDILMLAHAVFATHKSSVLPADIRSDPS